VRFVLIHGGFHGAWCWDRTIPELERLGHEAIAIDLPGHGTRADDRSTLADRRDAILSVLESEDVLVGHSGGGFDITIAADAAPERVGHLVYLAAGLPEEGRRIVDSVGGETRQRPDGTVEVLRMKVDDTGMSRLIRPNDAGRWEVVDFEAARAYFYHDCDEATARWAFSMCTPSPVGFNVEPISVPTFWEADLGRSYILCLDDRAKSRSMSDHDIDRLGVAPVTIDSSHSPFLSRPAELADRLVEATKTTPVAPLRPE
jgi:pimeloyl-ACP methyl ester carboxylesterase